MNKACFNLDFQDATLTLDYSGSSAEFPEYLKSFCVFDPRVGFWRAEAYHYADIFSYLYKNKFSYQDLARHYNELQLNFFEERQPRHYQSAALQSWINNKRRGIVVLPTGTGKSFLALLAMRQTARSTLIVVPTLDLMEQWATQLEKAFQQKIGLLGGGSKEILDITVSTYDSAVIHSERIGNKFALLIVDECHHLSGEVYQQLARHSIAPFRLGLTATPPDDEMAKTTIEELLGKICYRVEIDQLQGKNLADYQVQTIEVELDEEEMLSYQKNREIYINFLRSEQIQMSSRNGWQNFIRISSYHPQGRIAFEAYMKQRKIARGSKSKINMVWQLLQYHQNDRILIFTADNATAYEIGESFLLPVLTHHSKVAERREVLEAFRNGSYPILVTSRVLNEGVDVPEANVGIIVSGSGSVREHVQRLGRILRPAPNKEAILYELISAGTNEKYTSERRRQHRAYQNTTALSD